MNKLRLPLRDILLLTTMLNISMVSASDIPTLDCVIEPFALVEVSSAVEGVLESINVERNDLVKQGEILADLESDVEKASLAFAHLNASLNSEIRLRRASFDFDDRNRSRIEELYEKKAIPLHHKDEAETNAAKSRWLLMKAEDDKRLAALELARAKAVVKRKTVRSPIDGIVVARHKSAGEYIEDQPIVTIAQINPLRVEVIVPVEQFGSIKEGMTGKVFPELTSIGEHSAKVVSVDRVIDGASGTFDVRLELANPDYAIPSGLKCQVQLEAAGGTVDTVNTDESAATVSGDDLAVATRATTTEQTMCSAIGPLANRNRANAARAALDKFGTRITHARQLETSIDSYVVLGPREATKAANTKTQALIAKHGIRDTKFVEKGEFNGQMSYGVFTDKSAAEKRRRFLSKLGFAVALKPRLNQKPKIWLEVEGADLSEAQLLKAVSGLDKGSDLRVAPCGYPNV